jgi:serine/threonine protein kinase
MALEDEESPTLHGSSPGGILGERYQIREVLGRGGMGEVYRAFDLKLREDVALKAVRPELSIVTGRGDGLVRVGPVSGGEPYLLFGHKAWSARSRSLRTAAGALPQEKTGPIRLWPVPDVSKTPPHLRTHEEFLAMLRSWTNLRVVPDPESPTGWKLEVGPFPGWAKQPER